MSGWRKDCPKAWEWDHHFISNLGAPPGPVLQKSSPYTCRTDTPWAAFPPYSLCEGIPSWFSWPVQSGICNTESEHLSLPTEPSTASSCTFCKTTTRNLSLGLSNKKTTTLVKPLSNLSRDWSLLASPKGPTPAEAQNLRGSFSTSTPWG